MFEQIIKSVVIVPMKQKKLYQNRCRNEEESLQFHVSFFFFSRVSFFTTLPFAT